MKRFLAGLIGIVVLVIAAYISFGLYRNALLATNIAHGSYAKCFDDPSLVQQTVSGWGSATEFDIRFVAQGNGDCYAPKFPSIEVSSAAVTHWVHPVTTTGQKQLTGKHASFGAQDDLWTFVDVGAQEKREHSIPFYSLGTVFRDNPGWQVAPHMDLNWQGMLFGLTERHGVLYPVGGVSWGFHLAPWALLPTAITPLSLGQQAWLDVVDLLNQEYPDYQFSRNIVTSHAAP
ncbi:hypothetical protein [Photobacterium sp. TY1-4]|uniref:hypothetical protein n=1 Tax=Photobacterium sp. TY1-4 TaxID=2899122 RepID=UPI0021C226D5|nr:hypothetical protein [Photobacterium sp. TY1-4]UXI00083.1 hypothetical protein NH461_09610 [Photobacterium sp. TY1-4]